jgi:CBS domain-containing protein
MERHVVIAQPEQSVDQCMAVMSEERVRHLPVLEGNKPIGIVSIGDLVKSIIGDQKFVIVQLERYIHGERAVVDG